MNDILNVFLNKLIHTKSLRILHFKSLKPFIDRQLLNKAEEVYTPKYVMPVPSTALYVNEYMSHN